MARPLSEEKKQAILKATTRLIAEDGLNASTSRIAKVAGVSEGTIFTYFSNKDELLNQLYLELKSQLRSALVFPSKTAELRELVWLSWEAFITWGIRNPLDYNALEKLSLCNQITETTKTKAAQEFCDVVHLLEKAMATGVLRHQSPDFVGSLMAAMAKTTMDFMTLDQSNSESVCKDGFAAFWNAVT